MSRSTTASAGRSRELVNPTHTESAAKRRCALHRYGCGNNARPHSVLCYTHDRRIMEWSGRTKQECDDRKQDLKRYLAFHDYTGPKRSN